MKPILMYLCCIFILFSGKIHAQFIETSLLSGYGMLYNSPGMNLSSTSGETITGTFASSPSVIVNQGFQQSYLDQIITGLYPEKIHSCSVFPNPVRTSFTITGLNETTNGAYAIVNSLGVVVHLFRVGNGSTEVSMMHLPSGNYFIQDPDHRKMLKIVKE